MTIKAWLNQFRGLVKVACLGASTVFIGFSIYDSTGYLLRLVDGMSMQPTLNPHLRSYKPYQHREAAHIPAFDDFPQSFFHRDWVLLSANARFNITTGDIVAFYHPKVPTNHNIKRVIATEHQKVMTRSYKNRTVIVPKGQIWVEGDNYSLSEDSNGFGPIPAGLVFGKAIAVVWPPSRWRRLKPELPHSECHKFLRNASERDQSSD